MRPPSIGKAGIRLKSARNRFTDASRSTIETLALSTVASEPPSSVALVTRTRPSPITTLTSGPAIAMRNSSSGFSGMRSSRATPPIGSRMTSGVRTPKARAVRMWPNSCASTQRNRSTMKRRLL